MKLMLNKQAVFVATVALAVWQGPRAMAGLEYATSDQLERHRLNTERLLHNFESTGEVKPVIKWMMNGPGEAFGMQRSVTLGNWAIHHPPEFRELIKSLPPQDTAKFVKSFAWSLADSGQADEFIMTFQTDDSPTIKLLVAQLKKQVVVPWPTLKPAAAH
ncbi:hypothetical protein EON80_03690 [bacterium]|nr:MAG: hypothetical protein EON80_03690 [bacterium]